MMENETLSDSVITLIKQKESLEAITNVTIENQDNTEAYEILDKLKAKGRKDHQQKKELQKRIACAEERIKNLESLLDSKQSISSNGSAPITIQTLPFGQQDVPTTKNYFPTDNVLKNILPKKSKPNIKLNVSSLQSISSSEIKESSDTITTSSLLSNSSKNISPAISKREPDIHGPIKNHIIENVTHPKLEICAQFSFNSDILPKHLSSKHFTNDSLQSSNSNSKIAKKKNHHQNRTKSSIKGQCVPEQIYPQCTCTSSFSEYSLSSTSTNSESITPIEIAPKKSHMHLHSSKKCCNIINDPEIDVCEVREKYCSYSKRKQKQEEDLTKKAMRAALTPNPGPCPCPVCAERRRRESHKIERCRRCSFEATGDDCLADLERFRLKKFAEMDAYSKKIEKTRKKTNQLSKIEMKAFKKSIRRVTKAESKMREKGVKMPDSNELIDYICRQFHQFLKAEEPISFETAYKLVGRAVYYINKTKI